MASQFIITVNVMAFDQVHLDPAQLVVSINNGGELNLFIIMVIRRSSKHIGIVINWSNTYIRALGSHYAETGPCHLAREMGEIMFVLGRV